MNRDLEGRVAIVTGAGKGLGRAYALELAARGAAVVVNNRRHAGEDEAATSAAAVVGTIRAAGGRAVADHGEVQRDGAGDAMVARALETFGRLDIVVANAAAPQASSFARTGPAAFRHIFDVSFVGTLQLLQAAWPHLRERGYGRIVTTSSSAGRYGQHGLSAYGAAKGAIESLTRTLAAEGIRHGIQVNAVSPYAASQMTRQHLREDIAARFTPERVAPLVAWLCSPSCPANGEVLVCGGGLLRRAFPVETPALPFKPGNAADVHAALMRLRGVPFADSNAAFNALVGEAGLAPPQRRKGEVPAG